MIESIYADAFISRTLNDAVILSGLGGEKIYANHAPQGVEHPFIIYSLMSASDYLTLNKARVMVHLRYWVRLVYIRPANDAIRAAANQMDELLGTVRNGKIDLAPDLTFNTWREAQRVLSEYVVNVGDFLHLGGEYIVEVY